MIPSLCILAVFAVALFSFQGSIHATVPYYQWTYIYWTNGGVSVWSTAAYAYIMIVLSLGTIGSAVACLIALCTASNAEHDVEEHGDDAEQARRLRERQALIEAETEYMASAIKHARTAGEYGELDQIAAHERAMRQLRQTGSKQ